MPRSHRSGRVFPSEEIQGAWEVMAFGMVSEKTHKEFFQACSGHAWLGKQFWGTSLLPVRGSPCGLPASLKLSSWGRGGGGSVIDSAHRPSSALRGAQSWVVVPSLVLKENENSVLQSHLLRKQTH